MEKKGQRIYLGMAHAECTEKEAATGPPKTGLWMAMRREQEDSRNNFNQPGTALPAGSGALTSWCAQG